MSCQRSDQVTITNTNMYVVCHYGSRLYLIWVELLCLVPNL